MAAITRFTYLGTLSLILTLASCGGSTQSSGGPKSSGEKDRGGASGDSGGDEGAGASEASAGQPLPDMPEVETNKQLEEKRAMSAKIDMTLKGDDGSPLGIQGKTWAFSEDRRAALEAAKGSSVTKMSVLFGKRNKSGLESWSTLPTEGKGYDVVLQDGQIAVLDNGKKPASTKEREIVLAEYGYMGSPNPLLVAAMRAKESGEAVTLDPAAYNALLGHVPELNLENVTLTFAGTEDRGGRRTGTLEVDVKGSLKDGETSYEYALEGPALLDMKTGYVVDLQLNGKVKARGMATAKGKRFKAEGEGTMTLTRAGKLN